MSLTREENKFTPEEQHIVNIFKKQGWKFDFESQYDYHKSLDEGYSLKVKSPRMTEWRTYYKDQLTPDELMNMELNAIAWEEAKRREDELRDFFQEKIIEVLQCHPNITLQELANIRLHNLFKA